MTTVLSSSVFSRQPENFVRPVKAIAIQPQTVTIGRVSLTIRTMAFVMLAVWLSVSTICVTECASLAHDDLCCPKAAGQSSDQPASPGTDSNCVLSSALTKAQDEERVAWNSSLLPAVAQVLFLVPPNTEPVWRITSADSAQTLSHEWQFITRTALPPRAPSLAS